MQRARQRGYTDLKLVRRHVGEIEGPDGARLILRRQLIDEERGKHGQRELWEVERYRYIVTNLPREWTPTDIVDATYQRCDQENLIEGMGSGIAAWRMPVAEMRGNAAWLQIARLAWNLGKWMAFVALGKEASRWEWKRLRRCFVDFAAQVVRSQGRPASASSVPAASAVSSSARSESCRSDARQDVAVTRRLTTARAPRRTRAPSPLDGRRLDAAHAHDRSHDGSTGPSLTRVPADHRRHPPPPPRPRRPRPATPSVPRRRTETRGVRSAGARCARRGGSAR